MIDTKQISAGKPVPDKKSPNYANYAFFFPYVIIGYAALILTNFSNFLDPGEVSARCGCLLVFVGLDLTVALRRKGRLGSGAIAVATEIGILLGFFLLGSFLGLTLYYTLAN